jgi:hypothetical protein
VKEDSMSMTGILRHGRRHKAAAGARPDQRVLAGTLCDMVAGARLGFLDLTPGTGDYRHVAGTIWSLWDFPLSVICEGFIADAQREMPELRLPNGDFHPAILGHLTTVVERAVMFGLVDAPSRLAHANCHEVA